MTAPSPRPRIARLIDRHGTDPQNLPPTPARLKVKAFTLCIVPRMTPVHVFYSRADLIALAKVRPRSHRRLSRAIALTTAC